MLRQSAPLRSRRRGGCTIQEKSRSLISSCRRGGVVQEFLDHTTPSASLKVASLLLLDVAASPPPAEEGTRLLQLQNAPAVPGLVDYNQVKNPILDVNPFAD